MSGDRKQDSGRGSKKPFEPSKFSLGDGLGVPARHTDECWEKFQAIKALSVEFSKLRKKFFDDMKKLQADREACGASCPRCQVTAKISGKAAVSAQAEPPQPSV